MDQHVRGVRVTDEQESAELLLRLFYVACGMTMSAMAWAIVRARQ